VTKGSDDRLTMDDGRWTMDDGRIDDAPPEI
jgi:hypothetical protein